MFDRSRLAEADLRVSDAGQFRQFSEEARARMCGGGDQIREEGKAGGNSLLLRQFVQSLLKNHPTAHWTWHFHIFHHFEKITLDILIVIAIKMEGLTKQWDF